MAAGIAAALLGTQLKPRHERAVPAKPTPAVVVTSSSPPLPPRDDPVYGLLASSSDVQKPAEPAVAGGGGAAVASTAATTGAASGGGGRGGGIGPTPAASSVLAAAAAEGSVVCSPRDGRELQAMVAASDSCTVIVLTRPRDQPYIVTRMMNVTSAKVIVGNPLTLPIIRAEEPTIASSGSVDLASAVSGELLRRAAASAGPERIFDGRRRREGPT